MDTIRDDNDESCSSFVCVSTSKFVQGFGLKGRVSYLNTDQILNRAKRQSMKLRWGN